MSRHRKLGLAMAALCGLWYGFLSAPLAADDIPGVALYEVEAPFEQVRQDLADAIINRGYTIDYNGKVGAMLARTAADVGATRPIYSEAEFLQFCSVVLSRRAMEADPRNIAYCPYVLFVYAPADDPNTSTVGFRRLNETGSEASRAAIREINALLDEIVREAAGIE